MIHMQFQDPRLARWQTRLARIPRWGWIAIFIGMALPLVILGVGLLAVALFSGLIVFAAVTMVAVARRLFHRRKNHGRKDEGRNNVIVVRSVRVIDP